MVTVQEWCAMATGATVVLLHMKGRVRRAEYIIVKLKETNNYKYFMCKYWNMLDLENLKFQAAAT